LTLKVKKELVGKKVLKQGGRVGQEGWGFLSQNAGQRRKKKGRRKKKHAVVKKEGGKQGQTERGRSRRQRGGGQRIDHGVPLVDT